jgi:hypothetical protein
MYNWVTTTTVSEYEFSYVNYVYVSTYNIIEEEN